MEDKQGQDGPDPQQDYITGRGHGPQGIDKAPGEETSQDIENMVSETQKGKNKVDGDPSQESDQPIDVKEWNAVWGIVILCSGGPWKKISERMLFGLIIVSALLSQQKEGPIANFPHLS